MWMIALFALVAELPPSQTMVRVVIRDTSPTLPPGDFARRPRIVYRTGTCCMRLEEEKDPAAGSQLLLVVNEPDVWDVDLSDRTATHAVDPGPTFNARMPIDCRGATIAGLEVGRELSFMKVQNAAKEGPVKCGTSLCHRYATSRDGYQVILLVSGPGETPVEVRVLTPDGEEIVLTYDEYESGLPVAPELFKPPVGVRVREAE